MKTNYEDLQKDLTYQMYVTTNGEDGEITSLEMTAKGGYFTIIDYKRIPQANGWTGCEVTNIEFYKV